MQVYRSARTQISAWKIATGGSSGVVRVFPVSSSRRLSSPMNGSLTRANTDARRAAVSVLLPFSRRISCGLWWTGGAPLSRVPSAWWTRTFLTFLPSLREVSPFACSRSALLVAPDAGDAGDPLLERA